MVSSVCQCFVCQKRQGRAEAGVPKLGQGTETEQEALWLFPGFIPAGLDQKWMPPLPGVTICPGGGEGGKEHRGAVSF